MCPEQDVRAVLCSPVLQAQRLAAIDALLKNGAGAGAAGSGDLEVKLRRLATDVRQLKDRMGELLGGAAAGQQVRSGPRNIFSEHFFKGFALCFVLRWICSAWILQAAVLGWECKPVLAYLASAYAARALGCLRQQRYLQQAVHCISSCPAQTHRLY